MTSELSKWQENQTVAARRMVLRFLNKALMLGSNKLGMSPIARELYQIILTLDQDREFIETERVIAQIMGSKAKGEDFLKKLTQTVIDGNFNASTALEVLHSVMGS